MEALSAKLYTDIFSGSPMKEERVSILTGDRPGSTPEECYVLSCSVQGYYVSKAPISKHRFCHNADNCPIHTGYGDPLASTGFH